MRLDNFMDKVLKNGFKHSRSVSEFNIFSKPKHKNGSQKSQSSRKSSAVPDKSGSSTNSLIEGGTPVHMRRPDMSSQGSIETKNFTAEPPDDEIQTKPKKLMSEPEERNRPSGLKQLAKAVDGTIKKQHAVKFLKVFSEIPRTEVLINYYSCAFVGEILTQGYLYVSRNYFCFSSSLFGVKTQMIIPVNEVINITLEKVAYLIPNAVGIVTPHTKYVFGSLLSRNKTYKLLVKVLEKHRSNAALNTGPSTPLASSKKTPPDELSGGNPNLQSSVTPVPPNDDQPSVGNPDLSSSTLNSSVVEQPVLPNSLSCSSHSQVEIGDFPQIYTNHSTSTMKQYDVAWVSASGYLIICLVLLFVTVLVSIHISYRISNIELLIAQNYHNRYHYSDPSACSPGNSFVQSLDASAAVLNRVKTSIDQLAEQMIVTNPDGVSHSTGVPSE